MGGGDQPPIGRVRDRFDDFVPIESGVTMES